MRLSWLLILIMQLATPESINVVLSEEGLSHSIVYSELVKYEEGIPSRGNARDRAGNHYFIETENQSGSRITKRMPSAEETLFASLESPPGYEAEFESLFFYPSGNLVFTVVFRKKGAEWLPRRDYYMVEGLPGRDARFRILVLVSGVSLLVFILILVRALYRHRHRRQISWLT